MESSTQQPAVRRPVANPAVERRKEEFELHEAANREKVEAMASPEEPTPTQAEADALKEGVAQGGSVEAQVRRDVRPNQPASGYQTR